MDVNVVLSKVTIPVFLLFHCLTPPLCFPLLLIPQILFGQQEEERVCRERETKSSVETLGFELPVEQSHKYVQLMEDSGEKLNRSYVLKINKKFVSV